MKILVNKNNEVQFYGDIIEYGKFEDNIEKWKIETSSSTLYVIDSEMATAEVDEIPNDFIPNKYCYTDEKGFYLNEDYSEPVNMETEIKRLTEENLLLKTKIDNMQEVLDYLVMK